MTTPHDPRDSRDRRHRRPLRRIAVLLAVLIAGSGPSVAATGHQGATTAGAGVTGADLPQVVRVAATFPYLRDGRRLLLRSDRLEYARRDCSSQSRGYPAQSVRFASFTTARGGSPYFEGLEDPTYVVYEFTDAADARAGYAKIADFARRCQGRRAFDLGTVEVDSFAVPRLGARQVGYRTSTVEEGDPRDELEVYVLAGRRIERSWIQLDEGRARVPHVLRMARVLAGTAR